MWFVFEVSIILGGTYFGICYEDYAPQGVSCKEMNPSQMGTH